MATLQQIRKKAAEHKATVEQAHDGRYCSYQVAAPNGFVWDDTGSIHLVATWLRGDAEWREIELEDLLCRIEFGLREDDDDAS